MRKRTRDGLETVLLLGLASLAAAVPLTRSSLDLAAWRQESRETRMERVSRGAATYRIYCASCHGASGRGDGPMADVLKVHPVNLTSLSRTNEGRFPEARVYEAIDGRAEVAGHGPGSMPVWGLTFQVSGRDSDQETEVRERILDLMTYIQSIQDEGNR